MYINLTNTLLLTFPSCVGPSYIVYPIADTARAEIKKLLEMGVTKTWTLDLNDKQYLNHVVLMTRERMWKDCERKTLEWLASPFTYSINICKIMGLPLDILADNFKMIFCILYSLLVIWPYSS